MPGSSLRRILSSRANGRLSRGPVTPAGKRRSSLNALKHGLLARTVLLESESPEALRELFRQHVQRLAPADGLELAFVEEMVAACWRLRRAWAIETRLLDKEISNQSEKDTLDKLSRAFARLASRPSTALLHRYQTRLHNIYHRALQNLLLLRLAVPNEPTDPAESTDYAPEFNAQLTRPPESI